MKITLSVIKADTGSIGGHNRPSEAMVVKAKEQVESATANGLLTDARITFTGDDIALLMIHTKGVDNADIHKLAWDTFVETTKIAKSQGLYGAGQDLLKDAFSGNVRGMGPGSAEIEIEERPAEPFIVFAGDKCGPGVFNYPLFECFANPYHNAGLLLAPEMRAGFTFTIMDVNNTEADKIITLKVPEDYYDIATLLRDPNHFVIESVRENATGLQAAAASTSRLHNIAGKYVGKDDPVAIVRTQKTFPSTGEILSPWALAHYTLGDNRGSHHVAVMPVKQNSIISYFDILPKSLISSISHFGITFGINPQRKHWRYARKVFTVPPWPVWMNSSTPVSLKILNGSMQNLSSETLLKRHNTFFVIPGLTRNPSFSGTGSPVWAGDDRINEN